MLIFRQLFDPHATDETVADIGQRKEGYYRAMVRTVWRRYPR